MIELALELLQHHLKRALKRDLYVSRVLVLYIVMPRSRT